MITKLSHVTLFVNNQEEAKNFYVNTLGFDAVITPGIVDQASWDNQRVSTAPMRPANITPPT